MLVGILKSKKKKIISIICELIIVNRLQLLINLVLMRSTNFFEEFVRLILKWLKKVLPPKYFRNANGANLNLSNYQLYFTSVMLVLNLKCRLCL